MKKMLKPKSIVRVLLIAMLSFVLLACSSNSSEQETSSQDVESTETTNSQEESESTSEQAEEATEENAEAGAISVIDQKGREVNLDQPAERIVTTLPSDAEILFELGAGDKIIARGEYVDYPAEEVEDIPVIATGEEANAEEVVALDADLVVLGNLADEDYVKQLEDAGVQILQFDAQSIDQVYESIEILGQVVAKEAEADQLVQDMKDGFSNLQEQAQNLPSQTVYFEISPLEFGLWTGGQGTFMHEIGELLNLENVFADVEQWGEVSQEQVLERNPDVIVTTNEAEDAEEEIAGRDGWDRVAAVQNGQVYAADNSEMTRPGPRLLQAAQNLFDFISSQGQEEDQAA